MASRTAPSQLPMLTMPILLSPWPMISGFGT